MSQNANDKQEVESALEEIKETTSDLPDKMSLDNGYMSGDNLEAFDGKDIDVYMATGKGEKKDQRPIEDSNRKIKKSDFTYDGDLDFIVAISNGNFFGLDTQDLDINGDNIIDIDDVSTGILILESMITEINEFEIANTNSDTNQEIIITDNNYLYIYTMNTQDLLLDEQITSPVGLSICNIDADEFNEILEQAKKKGLLVVKTSS